MDVRITPPEEIIEASVALPLSKSISNRALIMNALTPGSAPLAQVANCDDTAALKAALEALAQGAAQPTPINVGPAGTAMRFLTAYVAATPGLAADIDGSERMRQRPIGPLVEALRQCGADIEYLGEQGYPPLRIAGANLHGGNIEIDATVSSQFISALMMVAPTFDSPLTITLKGEPSSLPYLRMTLAMMEKRGIKAELYRDTITIEPGIYLATDQKIERDWSAASYWYEVTALSGGWITLDDMQLPSIQGDSHIVKIFEQLGITTEPEDGNLALNPSPEVFSRLDLDLSDNPDVAQTLAVACCFMSVPFKFTGLASLRIKETDRLAALKAELAKLSFDIAIIGDDTLAWQYERVQIDDLEPIDPHGDHRMAMAFAPASIFAAGLVIKDAEVVAKSYPEFWDHLRSVGFNVETL